MLSDLDIAQLRKRVGEVGVKDAIKFGHASAGLLHLVDVPHGIRVRGHLATLRTVREYGCQVEIVGERKTANYKGGKPFRVMREVKPEDIERVKV